jgi:peptidoglycan/xylan/chitin deacetylase (PgdA/CDA1 family)
LVVVILAGLMLLPDTGVVALPRLRPPSVAHAATDDFNSDRQDLLDRAAVPSASPLALGELSQKPAPPPTGPVTYVPILLYHYIRINPNPLDRVGFGLSTTPTMFRAEMQYLADQGFHVISLHEAVLAVKHHIGLPSRPVVLTFDDGYSDFFTNAVPILRSHGFTATDFVISGRMGLNGFMTPNQVVAADAMGFTIGAHTVDHLALASLSPVRASWEIQQSKRQLESLLGHPVADFAYPYGSFNAFDVREAQRLGFETAVSTLYGSLHSAAQLFELSRIRMGGGVGLSYFASALGGPRPTLNELRLATGSPSPAAIPSR